MGTNSIKLGELIIRASEFNWKDALYMESKKNKFEANSDVLTIDSDKHNVGDVEIKYKNKKFGYIFSVQTLQSIVKNARQQQPHATINDLVDAVNFYYENDAFINYNGKIIVAGELTDDIKGLIREIEKSLVEKRYDNVSLNKIGNRLTNIEIRNVINDYKKLSDVKKITLSPISVYKDLKLIKVVNTSARQWCVDFDLWFDNKPSDLTLQLTITQDDKEGFTASIEDIHVL